VLVEVVRSGLIEACHDGAVAVCDPSGRLTRGVGDIGRPYFVRSAAKPLQGTVTARLVGGFPDEHLAVACGSHVGDPIHVEIVREMLDSRGLGEAHLGCPPAWPASPEATRRLQGDGHVEPRPIWHNCSGKHAAMLAACVRQGWDVASYLEPDHPLQLAIADHVAATLGAGVNPVGVDGCGAPVFRTSTGGLARGFAAMMADPAAADVVRAMSRFPALTSGPGQADATAATWLGGVAKRGAEGCMAVALPGRGALAVKVWDGAPRAVAAALFHALDLVGWIPNGSRSFLESAMLSPVLGGGRPVGAVVPTFDLEHM
jgi:L-asparaginase II